MVHLKVELARRLFCYETAAALECAGYKETSSFVLLVSKFFTIMNTKSSHAEHRLRDPLRQAIREMDCPPIHFLKEFRDMVDKMKPPRVIRKSCDKTLTTATAVATVNCIDGFHKMAEYLLGNGYSYVLFGRYTSDHIEKLFGKWRQAAGGNYYISVSEIMQTQRIQWANVTISYLDRPLSTTSTHNCDMCLG